MRHVRRSATLITALGVLALLTGCGAFHPQDYPLDGPTASATANPHYVTAEQFGHSWPLTVASGTVSCELSEDGDPVLTFTDPDGVVYALNALPDNAVNEDINQILDGSIGPLRSFALTVCNAERAPQ